MDPAAMAQALKEALKFTLEKDTWQMFSFTEENLGVLMLKHKSRVYRIVVDEVKA